MFKRIGWLDGQFLLVGDFDFLNNGLYDFVGCIVFYFLFWCQYNLVIEYWIGYVLNVIWGYKILFVYSSYSFCYFYNCE